MAPSVRVLTTLIVQAMAFRVRQRTKSNRDQTKAPPKVGPSVATVAAGEPGQVDFMFSVGAPGPGSPGLQNQRGDDPCFPGMRIYHAEKGGVFGNEWIDVVARVANLAYYWHAWVPSAKIDVSNHKKTNYKCNKQQTWEPGGFSPSSSLHSKSLYIDSIEKVFGDPFFSNITIFTASYSYIHDREHVFELVQEHGWGLVGSAFHAGGGVFAGEQISHLIQHPSTNECVLTFQGTASIQGWINNFNFPAEHFCGLVDADESCGGWSTCKVRHARGSFVHGGFRGRYLAIVGTDEFQNNVRPHLGKCATLVASGHSLGGAVAELFSACASKAPQPGEYGYEDYEPIAWTKEAPARLSYVGAEGKW